MGRLPSEVHCDIGYAYPAGKQFIPLYLAPPAALVFFVVISTLTDKQSIIAD